MYSIYVRNDLIEAATENAIVTPLLGGFSEAKFACDNEAVFFKLKYSDAFPDQVRGKALANCRIMLENIIEEVSDFEAVIRHDVSIETRSFNKYLVGKVLCDFQSASGCGSLPHCLSDAEHADFVDMVKYYVQWIKDAHPDLWKPSYARLSAVKVWNKLYAKNEALADDYRTEWQQNDSEHGNVFEYEVRAELMGDDLEMVAQVVHYGGNNGIVVNAKKTWFVPVCEFAERAGSIEAEIMGFIHAS